ncbi:MAG: hypothetical protein ACRDH5_00595, partial [bacterium]
VYLVSLALADSGDRRAGTYSVTEVYAAEEWDGAALAPTRRRYAVSFKALHQRAGLPSPPRSEALGSVDWRALKARWPTSDGDWFHLRAAVSHFLAA